MNIKNIGNEICGNSDKSYTDSNEGDFEENEFQSSSEYEMNNEKKYKLKIIIIKKNNLY